ncbi:hypothetical protein FJT64_001252 [Amphibalanus amphitrite]|uniref:C2H2-type domain-containing protein n=1 Tax=Amphibalanus amphitrite TaxID=1232801 RepID=A0A6A4V840_AMPAM|nr:hypothetical protein FJT64_001252 [Amphibalanus amphitrite]
MSHHSAVRSAPRGLVTPPRLTERQTARWSLDQPAAPAASQRLRIGHVNVRHLAPAHKIDEIRLMLNSHNLDILCLTETFLSSDISDGLLLFPGYRVYRRDRAVPRRGRTQVRGGGIVVLVRSDIGACELDVSPPGDSRVEFLWLGVASRGKRHARRRRELRILAALADTTQVTEATNKEALAARLAKGNARLQPVPLKEGELPDCITRRCEGKVRQKVSYTCDLCTVQLTSLVKVQEHLVSQRHTALQEGRPDPTLDGQHPASKTRRKASVKNSWFW